MPTLFSEVHLGIQIEIPPRQKTVGGQVSTGSRASSTKEDALRVLRQETHTARDGRSLGQEKKDWRVPKQEEKNLEAEIKADREKIARNESPRLATDAAICARRMERR